MHPHTNISRALPPRTVRKQTTPGFNLCLEAFVQRSLSLHQHFLTSLTFGDKTRRKIGSHKGETSPYCFIFCCPRSHLPQSWQGFNLIITFCEAFASADRGDAVRAATATDSRQPGGAPSPTAPGLATCETAGKDQPSSSGFWRGVDRDPCITNSGLNRLIHGTQ